MTTNNIQKTSRKVLFVALSTMLIQLNPAKSQSTGQDTIYPVQISIVPGLGTLGEQSEQAVSRFSFNLIGGNTGGVSGLELASIFNINHFDVRNVQLAGVFNTGANDFSGVQAAGVFNRVSHAVTGAQFAGVGNCARHVKGGQFAGVINRAEEVQGAQFAGAVNIARGRSGTQVAGVINIAGNVRGVQLAGLLNVADSSDYPIGLINLIKNGYRSVAMEVDETGTTSVVFRSGGRVLYGLLGVGYRFDSDPYDYALEGGVGARILDNDRFTLAIEAVQRTTTDFDDYIHMASLRILPGYRFGKLEVFAGPTANVIYADDDGGSIQANGWVWHRFNGDSDVRSLHGGITGGIRYAW